MAYDNQIKCARCGKSIPPMPEDASPEELLCDSCHDAGVWGEDPDYPVKDWQYEVANGDTRVGYWEWVKSHYEDRGYITAEEVQESVNAVIKANCMFLITEYHGTVTGRITKSKPNTEEVEKAHCFRCGVFMPYAYDEPLCNKCFSYMQRKRNVSIVGPLLRRLKIVFSSGNRQLFVVDYPDQLLPESPDMCVKFFVNLFREMQCMDVEVSLFDGVVMHYVFTRIGSCTHLQPEKGGEG